MQVECDSSDLGVPSAISRPADLARRSSMLWDGNASSADSMAVLGLDFANIRLNEAASELALAADQSRRMRVVFVNAHVMNSAWADPAYWRTVATAGRRYADGSGLALAARAAGEAFVDNVNGTDILPLLCAEAMRRGKTIYFLGGVAEAASGSAATMTTLGLGSAIAGAHHGHFAKGGADEEAAIAAVNASGASIVLVGMGVPLQDQWIEANAHRFNAPVQVGVGGLFDFYSGRASRAPAILRTIGMEWTWRLAREPRRMWKRYIVGNVKFMSRVASETLLAVPKSAVSPSDVHQSTT